MPRPGRTPRRASAWRMDRDSDLGPTDAESVLMDLRMRIRVRIGSLADAVIRKLCEPLVDMQDDRTGGAVTLFGDDDFGLGK